jgi:molybdopterin-guanine dinucleotide biosynthesis protein
MDVDHDYEPDELISYFPEVDIILAEGYKNISKPKAEIFRPEVDDQPVCVEDRHLIALVTDSDIDLGVPRFNTSDVEAFASYLIQRLGL